MRFGSIGVALAIGTVILGLEPPRAVAQATRLDARQLAEDFDSLWVFVDRTYAYFDPRIHDWQTVPLRYRARAASAAGVTESPRASSALSRARSRRGRGRRSRGGGRPRGAR